MLKHLKTWTVFLESVACGVCLPFQLSYTLNLEQKRSLRSLSNHCVPDPALSRPSISGDLINMSSTFFQSRSIYFAYSFSFLFLFFHFFYLLLFDRFVMFYLRFWNVSVAYYLLGKYQRDEKETMMVVVRRKKYSDRPSNRNRCKHHDNQHNDYYYCHYDDSCKQ